jgi:hypothetical protein
MKRFHITAILECPSDWTIKHVRQHFRKVMTDKEVDKDLVVTELAEADALSAHAPEPLAVTTSQKSANT